MASKWVKCDACQVVFDLEDVGMEIIAGIGWGSVACPFCDDMLEGDTPCGMGCVTMDWPRLHWIWVYDEADNLHLSARVAHASLPGGFRWYNVDPVLRGGQVVWASAWGGEALGAARTHAAAAAICEEHYQRGGLCAVADGGGE